MQYLQLIVLKYCVNLWQRLSSGTMSLLGSAAAWVRNTMSSLVADEEKKELKRKLEATQNDLATVRDDLAEARDISSAFEDAMEAVHTRSRNKMYKVLTKLTKCQETGELTNADLREMVSNLQDAHNVLDGFPEDDERLF